VLKLYARAILAGGLAGGAGWGVVQLLGGSHVGSWPDALLVTAVAGAAMGAVYLAGLKLLRVRELEDALAPLMRRLKR
jgi:putative peptidoglycan lipid II flippase